MFLRNKNGETAQDIKKPHELSPGSLATRQIQNLLNETATRLKKRN